MADDKKGAVADPLVALRHKYDPAIKVMHSLGFNVRNIEMQGGKLLIRAEAPSDQAKNKAWDEIKRVDPQFADLTADISVKPGAPAAAPPAARVAAGETYTVKAGDSLSKIAKQVYGNANAYQKIFEANKDQLSDPDKIKPGQVLKIPR